MVLYHANSDTKGICAETNMFPAPNPLPLVGLWERWEVARQWEGWDGMNGRVAELCWEFIGTGVGVGNLKQMLNKYSRTRYSKTDAI